MPEGQFCWCFIMLYTATCAQADTCMGKWPSSIRLWMQVCLFTFPPYVILNSSHCLREEIKTMPIKRHSAYFFGPFFFCCFVQTHISVFPQSLPRTLIVLFSFSPLGSLSTSNLCEICTFFAALVQTVLWSGLRGASGRLSCLTSSHIQIL